MSCGGLRAVRRTDAGRFGECGAARSAVTPRSSLILQATAQVKGLPVGTTEGSP
jgi:hypothetical protein